ncbi:MAG: tetratricopeptide repeat protein [Gemmatimonadetes bacterium]|nr:tetratricopeptide repeat protein [Gemmatimonadota bacterium]
MSAILVVILFLGLQPAAKNARGNELYHQEKYDEALAAYNEALAEDGENPALHYNRGNALHRAEQYPTSVQAYTNALDGDAPLGGRAWYNMGNSLYRMGRLEESIKAYKEGLRIKSDDLDMKYNLEFVMRQHQEHQDRRNAQNPPDDQDEQDNQDSQAQPPEPEQQQHEEGENPEQQQAPREGELSREQAERLLNALNRDELDIQRQLRRQQATQVNPEKDW